MTSSGTLTVLYSFCSQNTCSDGANPQAGLVQASDGNFYGTTELGGTGHGCLDGSCGTVFKITPQGTLTTLYSFCSQSHCDDGANPDAPLVQASDGNFYGTTFEGGILCSPVGCGTVFKITPSGALTTLHRFNADDGYGPYAGLVQASDGNFYGTTVVGGINGLNGQGTVFKITPSGALTTLYSFCSQANCSDGDTPYAALVLATDGNFYGTANGGGANGDGTVFKITPSGVLTTLHNFAGYPTEGALSTAALVLSGEGNLYGTTTSGGTNINYGTVFHLTLLRACTVCPNVE